MYHDDHDDLGDLDDLGLDDHGNRGGHDHAADTHSGSSAKPSSFGIIDQTDRESESRIWIQTDNRYDEVKGRHASTKQQRKGGEHYFAGDSNESELESEFEEPSALSHQAPLGTRVCTPQERFRSERARAHAHPRTDAVHVGGGTDANVAYKVLSMPSSKKKHMHTHASNAAKIGRTSTRPRRKGALYAGATEYTTLKFPSHTQPGGPRRKIKDANGKWMLWVLECKAKDRNAAIKEFDLSERDILDLKTTSRKMKLLLGQRRYMLKFQRNQTDYLKARKESTFD